MCDTVRQKTIRERLEDLICKSANAAVKDSEPLTVEQVQDLTDQYIATGLLMTVQGNPAIKKADSLRIMADLIEISEEIAEGMKEKQPKAPKDPSDVTPPAEDTPKEVTPPAGIPPSAENADPAAV